MPSDDRKRDSSDSDDFFRELQDAPAPPPAASFTRAFGSEAAPERSDSSLLDNSASRSLNVPAAPSAEPGAFTKEFGGGMFAPAEPAKTQATEQLFVPSRDFPPPTAAPTSGAFTRLFGPASIPADSGPTDVTRKLSPESISASPFVAPTPRTDTPKPSSFTEVFGSSSVTPPVAPPRSSSANFAPRSASDSFDFPAQPEPRAATPKPGAFTQLFTGSLPPAAAAAPEPSKPAPDFPWTQTQPSGPSYAVADPAPAPMPPPPAGASGNDATRLFHQHQPAEAAPVFPAAPAGPGAYTRVVSGARMREFDNFAPPAAPATAPSASPAFAWPVASAPSPTPAAAPPVYQPTAAAAWPGPQGPAPLSIPQAAPSPAPPASPLVKYLPLILGFNALLLIAILLVLFFALKK